MRYIPATPADRRAMLAAIGRADIDELFEDIPACARPAEMAGLPGPVPEWDLLRQLRESCAGDRTVLDAPCFLGAGAYHHFVPAVVDALASRSEFVTAYTPYQAELAQGTLQAIFEFQTLVCQLTGLEVANASMYDGGSALAEAVLMAGRISRRTRVAVSAGLHPLYRRVLATYARHLGLHMTELPLDDSGRTDRPAAEAAATGDLAALVIQNPNYFGVIEDVAGFAPLTHGQPACLVVAVAEPVSLGLLKSPGECGADIACGEGQGFGNYLSFGGPYVGFLAARAEHTRSMPGRIAGQTVDREGRRGFVLTLATREQHIRRARATSNICSNQALIALRATIALCALGRGGLADLAGLNARKAAYLRRRLLAVPGVTPVYDGPIFNELAVRLPVPVATFRQACLEAGILAGVDLEPDYPELAGCTLLAATECVRAADIDRLADLAAGLAREVQDSPPTFDGSEGNPGWPGSPDGCQIQGAEPRKARGVFGHTLRDLRGEGNTGDGAQMVNREVRR